MRQISITRIPNDRPPFPMPDGVSFPTYFTVQPGGAILETDSSGARRRARAWCTPTRGRPSAGRRSGLLELRAARRSGLVPLRGGPRQRRGGTDFEPGEGMRVHKFTMFTLIRAEPERRFAGGLCAPPMSASRRAAARRPIRWTSAPGCSCITKTDLAIADVLPLALTRTYRPGDTVSRAFGIGANHHYGLVPVLRERLPHHLAGAARWRAGALPADLGRARGISTPCWSTRRRRARSTSRCCDYEGTSGVDADAAGRHGVPVHVQRRPDVDHGPVRQRDHADARDRSSCRATCIRAWGKIERITGPSGRWIDLTYDSQTGSCRPRTTRAGWWATSTMPPAACGR